MQRVKSWTVGGTQAAGSGAGNYRGRKGRWEGESKGGWVKKGGNKSRDGGKERGREGGREGREGGSEGGRRGGRSKRMVGEGIRGG